MNLTTARAMAARSGRLENKVAIITGGARGLGRTFAERLAREGAKTMLCDLLDCSPVVRTIREAGGEAQSMRADISVEDEVQQMVGRTIDAYGAIDVLVNNAAVVGGLADPDFMKPVERLTTEDWDKMLRVNVRGTFLCCKAVIPQMKKQRRGSIVNVASTTGFEGEPRFLHYSTSKGGVMTMTKGLAKALGEYNITVNAVAPGAIMTESMKAVMTPEIEAERLQRQLLKRSIQPADVASAVVFLASDEASMITGQVLSVNGGEYLH
jgi:NAD(P)-dependent dehydrogenase (short-subunit alcohol dehydrogenase family)